MAKRTVIESLKARGPLPAPDNIPALSDDDVTSQYEELATKLSAKIVALNKQLRGRKGQLYARVDFVGPERQNWLTWERNSGEWQLMVWDVPNDAEEAEQHSDPEQGTAIAFNGRPLTQCSLDLKVAAAEELRNLIAELAKAERRQIERLRKAHAAVDALLGDVAEKEGE
jgi:hypothetical protein